MSSTWPSTILLTLSSQRWLAPLLAELAAQDGARFAGLLHRLQLPRDSLVRALTAAQALGWVMRNPGHGHPLRPEYLLTAAGREVARQAAAIGAAQAQLAIAPGTITRWGLPIVAAIHGGHDRFNGLTRQLAPATPRALSQALLALDRHALIARDIIDLRPPASRYWLTARGQILAEACSA
jgi:DNA-binding HxlR family transcriptional regulator